jgi:hypothetical protein
MQDWLRDQMTAYLAENRVATLSTAGVMEASTTLVLYRNNGVALECWAPCWTDTLYHLEQNRQVNLIITLGDQRDGLRWLHYQGRAELAPAADPPDPPILANPLYRRIKVHPWRIDLIDERQGPGIRATLELPVRSEIDMASTIISSSK